MGPPGGRIGPGGIILDRFGNPVLGADGKPLYAVDFDSGTLKHMFDTNSSVMASGRKLMNRPDMHKFFAQLEDLDPSMRKRCSPKVLDRLYDEAIQLQTDMAHISKGLTFFSFNVLINGAVKECGLGWISLMKRMVGSDKITEPQAIRQACKRFGTSTISAAK